MPKRILVPLDGSPLAERAAPYAWELARRTRASLVLLRAAAGAPDEEPAREAEAYLQQVASRLGEPGAEARVLAGGAGLAGAEVAHVIADEARNAGADLIVMSTHGRSGLGRWVYGSVAEAVLARAPVPVLLVRAWHAEPRPVVFGERPEVLVPLDGSPLAEAALPVAEGLARDLSGEISLVRAVPHPDVVFAPDAMMGSYLVEEQSDLEAEAREYLRALHERYEKEGRTVHAESHTGDAAGVIAAVSQERGAALVVMTTHGHTGLTRLVFGSVAAGVLREGTAPVVLVRPQRQHDSTTVGA